jgi:hypothetical protein
MEFTNEEMVKSLTSLIDETLEEIEEIKKSKFAASEISIGDDKSGIADKSKNGKLEAKKAEDEDEEEEEDEDQDEDDMDKADCMDKAEDDEDEEDEEGEESPSWSMARDAIASGRAREKSMDEIDPESKPKMKKSAKSTSQESALMKSYVDNRFDTLEKTIARLVDIVESIADAPVQRRGVPAGVAPLHKSQEEIAPLSKSQVANQLFELKKSGKSVDSADIFKVETGTDLTVLEIANKYGLR